jgi:Fe-S-cluster containining protein
MTQLPWYKDGLKFECTQCGDCCTGGPGFVWVTAPEIEDLANHLGESVEEFEARFVRKVGVRKSLREYSNGDCVFFDNQRRCCNVYEARPKQCRTWPFWDSNLKSPAAWKQTCEVCPGSGQGTLFQLQQIEDRRKVMKV